MEAVRLAMKDHGIPRKWMRCLAKRLRIKSVEDIASITWARVRRMPKTWRRRIIRLRNAYRRDNQTEWYSDN